jgi:truncated hemoglobin YjbI
MDERTFLIAIFGLFGSVSFIVWQVSRTVLRMRQQVKPLPSSDLEARLERIEAAVESIAIEVERNGELQRFNARLARGEPAPELQRIKRPITPH